MNLTFTIPSSSVVCAVVFGIVSFPSLKTNADDTEKADATPQPSEEQVRFYSEKVFPILKENCFRCHGTGEKLKAEFRLTSHDGLVRGGDYGPAFDPEKPAESLLLTAISYKDEQLKMPPKAALSPEDQEILTTWITDGAAYDPEKEILGSPEELKQHRGMVVDAESRSWWSYKPLSKAAPPTVPDPEWNAHPVDAHLRAEMEKQGLSPNPPAPRRALIRRAYFDLIGLPPTPEEVEAFVNDKRPDAFEHILDDLLSRPQYGEKWGRHWLDLVRYAETNGFERDGDKPEIWHYRDYIIRAFNEDKPYDQFIREQLAGDELDEVTPDSLIATGYYRLPQWDDEPADRLQHRYDVLDDIVRVTGETFLGSTIGCARCHDHKGDPIPQADYYSFMAFFHNVTHYNKGGTFKNVPNPANPIAEKGERALEINALEKEITEFKTLAAAKLEEAGVAVGVAKAGEAILPNSRGETPHEWKFTTAEPAAEWMEIAFDDAKWNRGKAGFGNGNPPNSRTRTAWSTKSIWLRTEFRLTEVPQAAFLDLYHDEDIEVFINGHRALQAQGHITNYAKFDLDDDALGALQTGKNVIAVSCKQTGGGQFVDVGLYHGTNGLSLEQLLDRVAKLDPETRPQLARYKQNIAKLDKLKSAVATEGEIRAHIVTEPGKDTPPLNIHLRGSAHAEGDPVEPAFPQVLSAEGESVATVPEKYKKNNTSGRRRVLAEWIASPENPITARVVANRIWQHHFGRGISPSTSDFGTLGEKPSHPELLDWLAAEFIRQGWSFKNMHKRLMLSRAYQMSSAPNTENLAKDPENTFFWRYNMRRLTAEEIRDTILAVSGDLNPKMGGAPVYPPLPPEVLATSSKPGSVWGKSNPEESARRSIYIKVKRSLRFPLLVDHDVADTDNTCAVRFVTTVPTQALGMLNSRLLNDQAAAFANRAKEAAGDDLGSQLKWAFENALSRPVTEEEVAECKRLYKKLQTDFALSPDDALHRICLVILNLNEFIYLD